MKASIVKSLNNIRVCLYFLTLSVTSLFLTAFSSSIFMLGEEDCCKDCGSVENCEEGNGMSTGFPRCEIEWDFSPPCWVWGPQNDCVNCNA